MKTIFPYEVRSSVSSSLVSRLLSFTLSFSSSFSSSHPFRFYPFHFSSLLERLSALVFLPLTGVFSLLARSPSPAVVFFAILQRYPSNTSRPSHLPQPSYLLPRLEVDICLSPYREALLSHRFTTPYSANSNLLAMSQFL